MYIYSASGGVALALWDRAAFGGVSAAKKKIGPPRVPQMVLKLPQSHEDSEYVFSFEIGQREGGFYSARTDTQTDRRTDG